MFTLSTIIIAIIGYFVVRKVLNWDEEKQVNYIVYAILIIIAIAFVRFETWLFTDTGWDSDNDGLSNDFEVEHGTDPDDYTWNFELDK